MSQFDILFNDFIRDDPDAFFRRFITEVDGELRPTGLVFEVDDVGIFYLNELRPPVSGTAHFVFWDRRFKGRKELCQETLKYAFEAYKFHRIETRVPDYAWHTIAAVKAIGFTQEGVLREAVLHDGNWRDIHVFSVLANEIGD